MVHPSEYLSYVFKQFVIIFVDRLRGYRYTNGTLETQDQYLKRMSGIMRLYSSILITKPRRGQTVPHPHGISNGWLWLSNILNLGMHKLFPFVYGMKKKKQTKCFDQILCPTFVPL